MILIQQACGLLAYTEAMGQQQQWTTKPFGAALAALLRERQGHPLELVNFTAFFVTVKGYSDEHLRLMVKGQRTLSKEAIEAMAAALGIEPDYFLEYRIAKAQEWMVAFPDEADHCYNILRAHVREDEREKSQPSKRRKRAT
jgi:hypothetical protein